MRTTAPTPIARVPAAERLLDTATELFSAEGIRAVGIDRILADAGVAKATLYSSYGSKDGLVEAYLRRLDARDRAGYAAAVEGVADARARVLTFFDLAIGSAPGRGFRGCRYLNAATEFPGEGHPFLAAVREHRDWVLEELTRAAHECGCREPGLVAEQIRVIYDGGLAGSKFDRATAPIDRARSLAAAVLSAACGAPGSGSVGVSSPAPIG